MNDEIDDDGEDVLDKFLRRRVVWEEVKAIQGLTEEQFPIFQAGWYGGYNACYQDHELGARR